MDLLKLIKAQVDSIPEEIRSTTKFSFVLTHIARAEHYLEEAERARDDQYLNDAVYRSNQAFEAILKEAYQFLTSKDASKQNIFQIENYIIRHKILNERVTDLLKNYRTQWRNPSTHDYSLTFSQQEALVGVVSVQMFIKVLLNQIVAEIAFRKERSKASEREGISSEGMRYAELPLIDKIAAICAAFAREFKTDSPDGAPSHIQVEGALEAYIMNVDPSLHVESDVRTSSPRISIKVRPDFFIRTDQEMMILELKMGYRKRYEEDAIYRMIQYLTVLKPKKGIIFFLQQGVQEYEYFREDRDVGSDRLTIAIVRPKGMVGAGSEKGENA